MRKKFETLGRWKRQGAELVDVPAHRFAEHSQRDHQLRWDDVPPGRVVRGDPVKQIESTVSRG